MIKQVNNSQKHISYFNRETNIISDSIWDLLTFDRIRSANIFAHEQNIYKYVPRPDQYWEVLGGIVPLPPRSRWLYDGNSFYSNNDRTIQNAQKASLDDLLFAIKKLLYKLKEKKIGIELSGGLDTSIVIGLLNYLGVKPFLIGMKSNRFEFRTELVIQEILQKSFSNTYLIPYEEYLPFMELIKTPVHQLPSPSSVFHYQGAPIAKICKANGINILLTGMGLDALFCDSPNMDGENGHPESWFSWMMDDDWFNEYIYRKDGINCQSAAASNLIIQIIWLMRGGQGEDIKKWWARNEFAQFIPRELVNFAYKSDHNGDYVEGLWKAADEITTLFRNGYEITRFEGLDQRSLNYLMNNLQKRDDKRDKILLARVHSLTGYTGL